MHALRARIPVLLAALFVVLPAGAAARDQYFCRMMGRVLDACCCAAARANAAPTAKSPLSEIKAKDCCERVERAGREAIPALRDGALRIESPAIGTVAPVAVVVAAPESTLLGSNRVQARAPPALGPPIFLKNCSLLT